MEMKIKTLPEPVGSPILTSTAPQPITKRRIKAWWRQVGRDTAIHYAKMTGEFALFMGLLLSVVLLASLAAV